MSASLAGIRALVTRPQAQSAALCAAIRAAGGEAIAQPLLRIEPVATSLPGAGLKEQDIAIFISANAVKHALALLRAQRLEWPAGLRCLAIGHATHRALCAAGLDVAEGGAAAMNSEELLQSAVLRDPARRRILLVKGEGGRELLRTVLQERGATVTEWVVYRRCVEAVDIADFTRMLRDASVNVLCASSGETLERLLGLLAQVPAGTIPAGTPVVVPGERVAALARRAGCVNVELADNATDAATLAALARIAARQRAAVEH